MNIQRLFLVLLPALLLPATSLLFAQRTNSMSVNVTATVMNDIELTTIRNMQFGAVQPGQRNLSIDPVLDPEAGKMIATGIPNSMVRVSFIREWELTNDQNNQTLTFSYQVAGNSEDNQNTAELLRTDNRGLTFNEDGEYYFWIGGSVTVTNAVPGNYEGEFTIEIEYM